MLECAYQRPAWWTDILLKPMEVLENTIPLLVEVIGDVNGDVDGSLTGKGLNISACALGEDVSRLAHDQGLQLAQTGTYG
jgi:hypothetical protein